MERFGREGTARFSWRRGDDFYSTAAEDAAKEYLAMSHLIEGDVGWDEAYKKVLAFND